MPLFEIITTAQVTIQERWYVEAVDAEDAENRFGEDGEFIDEKSLEDEHDRDVLSVRELPAEQG